MNEEALPAVIVEPACRPARRAVIWLHGLGADGHDFEPVAGHLGLPAEWGVRFVFPHAPKRPVTINNGFIMRAWYDIKSAAVDRDEDEAGIRASAAAVDVLIARERARGIPPAAIVLGGFSQGGAIALHAALRYPDRLAGVMALSCYLALPDALAGEAAPANADLPVFMAHGTADPIVPLASAVRARRRLAAEGYPVEWHDYGMAHGLCPEEVNDISVWLRRVLGP